MTETETRQQIVDAVRERGYLKGWTSRQLVARNACKLVEEAAEALVDCNSGSFMAQKAALQCREMAGELFDETDFWEENFAHMDVEAVKQEIADCYVVMSVLLEALEIVEDEPFDVAGAALAKAQGDVDRGVR